MNIKEFFIKNKKNILIFFSGVLVALCIIGAVLLIKPEKDYGKVKVDVKEVEKNIAKAEKTVEEEVQKIKEQEKNTKENETSPNGTAANDSIPNTNTNQGSVSPNDNDVVNYFLEQERYASGSEQDSSLRERLKNGVSTINQFLFHGGTIRGKTFHELSSSAKLQVLKLALSIDSKIDEHFPNYKENIKQGASNLKAKVIVTYLETTNKICTNYEDVCIQAREDFKTMKNSFKISFSLIAGLAKEGGTALKEWYLSTK